MVTVGSRSLLPIIQVYFESAGGMVTALVTYEKKKLACRSSTATTIAGFRL